MSAQSSPVEILRRFIADEDEAIAEGRSGAFWAAHWSSVTPLADRAERLLGAQAHRRFCLHYMRRAFTPPLVSQAALPHLLDAYRDLWPHADRGDAGIPRHVLIFLFGFDRAGTLPGALRSAAELKARRKLIAHLRNFSHLPGMRAKAKGFLPFVVQAEHIHQVLRHVGYRQHADADDAEASGYTDLAFWGFVYTALLAEGTRIGVLADMLDDGLDLPGRDRIDTVLNPFVQSVLPACGQDETAFRTMADRLAARERARAGQTEAAALARALGLPFQDEDGWVVDIRAPSAGHTARYTPPNIRLTVRPDPHHDWHLRLTAGEHQLVELTGTVIRNDAHLEPLRTLTDFPDWLRRIRESHGLAFDFAEGGIACGKKRSAARTLIRWIAGES